MDEIFIRWYVLGGDWINLGLPNYMHMDKNPDAGWKINYTWCGISMVMLKLELENGKTTDRETTAANGNSPVGY